MQINNQQQGINSNSQQINPLVLLNDMTIGINQQLAMLRIAMEQMMVQIQRQQGAGVIKNHGEKIREFEADIPTRLP